MDALNHHLLPYYFSNFFLPCSSCLTYFKSLSISVELLELESLFDHRVQRNSEKELEPINAMTTQRHQEDRDGAAPWTQAICMSLQGPQITDIVNQKQKLYNLPFVFSFYVLLSIFDFSPLTIVL